MNNIPTSSRLLTLVVLQLERSSGPPSYERLRQAVAHAGAKMPQVKQVGLVTDDVNFSQVIKQTADLGLIVNYEGHYIVTETGRNYLNGNS